MKKLSIEVPESADDVTIKTFQQLVKLQPEELNNPVLIISLLCGVPIETVSKMKDTDVLRLYKLCSDVLNDTESSIKFHWDYEGVRYSLHPEMQSMTFGELADAEKYFNESENFHKGLAVLYRKQTKASKALAGLYDIEKYTGTSETAAIFENMPLSYFYGVRTFFLRTCDSLEKISRQYLTQVGTQPTPSK